MILAVDGKADTIRCGRGFDTVRADIGLDVMVGCEDVAPGPTNHVVKPQPAGGAGGGEPNAPVGVTGGKPNAPVEVTGDGVVPATPGDFNVANVV